MFDLLFQNIYSFMFMQVIVTLVFVPIISYKRFLNTANAYCDAYYPHAKSDLAHYKTLSKNRLILVVVVCFVTAFLIVLSAQLTATELFNWDNQSGMIILFLLAMIPVAAMVFVQEGLFALLKKHVGSKRSASLTVQKWQDYFSIPLLLILFAGQLLFIATVTYFVQHPFAGFAGYSNLIGLLIINIIFAATTIGLYKSKKMGAIQAPEQRAAIKAKAIRVNTIIWFVAIYHLSLSMWIAGLEMGTLKLATQSLYFQLVILLTAYTLSLPKPFAYSKDQ